MRIQFGQVHFGVFSTFIELFKQVIWGDIWQLPLERNATDRTGRIGRTNRKKIILKLDFPGRLYLVAFAILAMFFQCRLTSQQFGHFSWTAGPGY